MATGVATGAVVALGVAVVTGVDTREFASARRAAAAEAAVVAFGVAAVVAVDRAEYSGTLTFKATLFIACHAVWVVGVVICLDLGCSHLQELWWQLLWQALLQGLPQAWL